jgi:transcriptional regulator with XRE-family HTH domain
MKLKEKVGFNLRRLREKKGWSQEKLAEVTGLHRTYISGIERGIRNPTLMIIEQIATALKIRPADLLKEDND